MTGTNGNRADIILGGDGEQKSLSIDNVPTSVLQALYREVTGKSETMSRKYQGTHIVTLADIDQLCSRISQTLEQFDVAEKTVSISVSHHKDDRLAFSSIERFKLYEVAKAKPVSSLIITTNFLLRVPETGKHYNYKLAVDITPFVLEEHEELMAEFSLPFSRLNGPPISATVEYIDYVVARSLLSGVDDWVSGLKSLSQPKLSAWLKRKHDLINILLPLTAILVAIYTSMSFIPDFEGSESGNLRDFAVWMCGSVSWIFILYVIFELLNKLFYHKVLELKSASFVVINRGDEINKAAVERRLSSNKWFLSAIGLAIAINVACGILAGRILVWAGWA